MSKNPEYNKTEVWGTFSDYNIAGSMPAINTLINNRYLLDIKTGDVNGDGILDKVYLYGKKPDGPTGIFADSITVTVKDGQTNKMTTVTPEFNAGYNARLFLGDFTNDKIDDIKVSIDTGGSGGYGYFYIYSFKNNRFDEIFNFDSYNREYKYKVDYADLYKVNISNVMLNKLFILDISYKGYDYLSEYYYVNENGKLKKPVQGEVLALSELVPIINSDKNNIHSFDLLAFQRIIGTSNSDTLGYIENLLSWNGQRFVSLRMSAVIPGVNLISLY
jgi:hypothetical protein